MKKFTFGICSSKISKHISDGTELNYETCALINEAQKIFDEVSLIHPGHTRFSFMKHERCPRVVIDNMNISSLSCLTVRGTVGFEKAISVLVRALRLCGCFILDPIARFSGAPSSKLLTTIDRYEKNIASDSHYAFSLAQAIELIHELYQHGNFPLLSKPIDGKRGRGICVFNSEAPAVDFAHKFFRNETTKGTPLLLQAFTTFVSEYRVIIIGDQWIGMAEKHRQSGKVAANAAAGGTFAPCCEPDVIKFVKKNINLEGILARIIHKNSSFLT
ncbi:hypothetical protein [Candidatus Entotheonella palauensis]|uniref:hypothetical protein n=1 Tax=Candidatus Entotheonella palauensis TaxID=93172 RepID=UPI000B7D6EB8|nr:hypothetical protein [Candidatus Entotheonella palauensis]